MDILIPASNHIDTPLGLTAKCPYSPTMLALLLPGFSTYLYTSAVSKILLSLCPDRKSTS
ncbi:MAG: hypothetical protein ACK5LT_01540 [Lachnospirales bacterium]